MWRGGAGRCGTGFVVPGHTADEVLSWEGGGVCHSYSVVYRIGHTLIQSGVLVFIFLLFLCQLMFFSSVAHLPQTEGVMFKAAVMVYKEFLHRSSNPQPTERRPHGKKLVSL